MLSPQALKMLILIYIFVCEPPNPAVQLSACTNMSTWYPPEKSFLSSSLPPAAACQRRLGRQQYSWARWNTVAHGFLQSLGVGSKSVHFTSAFLCIQPVRDITS